MYVIPIIVLALIVAVGTAWSPIFALIDRARPAEGNLAEERGAADRIASTWDGAAAVA